MLKVSIIIPVYNAGEYLDTCLESIARQTLDGIEVILVDDHGSDDSISGARKFAAGHPELSWKYTKTPANSGPGAARNAGLAVAGGEYICFVDADDWIEPDFCAKLYDTAVACKADLACCDIFLGDKIKQNPPTNNKRRFMRHFVSYFTTFAYRREFLKSNGIVFPGTHSAEDSCFLTCSVICAASMASVREPLYHYVLRDSSVSRKPDRQRASQRLASFRYLVDFAKSHGLYEKYRFELGLIMLKKGYLMAAKDRFIG